MHQYQYNFLGKSGGEVCIGKLRTCRHFCNIGRPKKELKREQDLRHFFHLEHGNTLCGNKRNAIWPCRCSWLTTQNKYKMTKNDKFQITKKVHEWRLYIQYIYLFHLPALKEGRLLEEQGLQVRREANQRAVYLGSLLNNSPTREAPYEYTVCYCFMDLCSLNYVWVTLLRCPVQQRFHFVRQ